MCQIVRFAQQIHPDEKRIHGAPLIGGSEAADVNVHAIPSLRYSFPKREAENNKNDDGTREGWEARKSHDEIPDARVGNTVEIADGSMGALPRVRRGEMTIGCLHAMRTMDEA
jgi:hypothetical protein